MEQQRNSQAVKLALKHYLQQMRRDWLVALPGILLPAIGTIFVVYVPPLIIAKILTKFQGHTPASFSEFLPYIFFFAAMWATGELLWRLGFQFMQAAEIRGIRRLYNKALEYLLQKDISFFHDNFAGSLTKKALGYARRYEEFMDILVFNIFPNLLPLIFVSFVLWRFSPWLVITLVSMLAITASVIVPLIRRRAKLVVKREAASNVTAGYIADVISNADTVKAFGREKFEAVSYRHKVNDFMNKTRATWSYHNLRINVVASPLYVLVNTLGLAVAIYISIGKTQSLQVIFISFSYYTMMTRVVWEFNEIYRRMESVFTDAAQFTEYLLESPKIADTENPHDLKVKKGEIELKNVTFKYSDASGSHLFKNFNLKIASGEKIALVGHSGGGKTTVTRLLLRFMDIDDGQILIDGQNIAEVKQEDLRSAIAYVPQEPAMFHRSLLENIRYGRLDATDEEVKAIAKMAHAEEFIDKLPAKYETLVGERGVKLSGGQRQRIAIARAMVKNAPILVLDEATSALDSESEKHIQDALWKLMEGRTAIAIAHRLSTIQRMDRIIVLEEGQIAEQGSHKELLEKNGTYARLWAHQSGGFLKD